MAENPANGPVIRIAGTASRRDTTNRVDVLRAVLSAAVIATVAPAAAAAPEIPAKTYHYTAITTTPAAQQGKVIVSGLHWHCQGSRCTISGPWPAPGLAACRGLAARVGRIKSYGHPGQQLTRDQLARCNKGIPGTVARTENKLAPAVTSKHVPGAVPAPRPGTGKVDSPEPAHSGSAPEALAKADRREPAPVLDTPRQSRATRLLTKVPPAVVAPSDRLAVQQPGVTIASDGSIQVRTRALTITGGGDQSVAVPTFTPVHQRTRELTITGRGAETVAVPEFTPKRLRTRELTITGTSRRFPIKGEKR